MRIISSSENARVVHVVGELKDSLLPLGHSVIHTKDRGQATLAIVGDCPLTTSGLDLSPWKP